MAAIRGRRGQGACGAGRPGVGAVLGALLGAAVGGGCGAEAPPPVERVTLGEGVVAAVGPHRIVPETVGRIAAAQGVPPPVALERALRDALFAAERARRGPDPGVTSAERQVLARAVLEQVDAAAAAQGPPTDAEVAAITERRFHELDRPPAARTLHAVVVAKEGVDRAPLRALAGRLHAALASAASPEEFERIVKDFPREGATLKAERLPPVCADGRTLPSERQPAGRFDVAFAVAAAALVTPGEHSPVVETSFGFHVVRLLERVPELRVPLEERRRRVTPEVHAERARRALEGVLEARRASTPVSVERSAGDLMGMVGPG